MIYTKVKKVQPEAKAGAEVPAETKPEEGKVEEKKEEPQTIDEMIKDAAQPEAPPPEPSPPPQPMPELPQPPGAPSDGEGVYNWGPYVVKTSGLGVAIEGSNASNAFAREPWGGTKVIELNKGGERMTIILVATKQSDREDKD